MNVMPSLLTFLVVLCLASGATGAKYSKKTETPATEEPVSTDAPATPAPTPVPTDALVTPAPTPVPTDALVTPAPTPVPTDTPTAVASTEAPTPVPTDAPTQAKCKQLERPFSDELVAWCKIDEKDVCDDKKCLNELTVNGNKVSSVVDIPYLTELGIDFDIEGEAERRIVFGAISSTKKELLTDTAFNVTVTYSVYEVKKKNVKTTSTSKMFVFVWEEPMKPEESTPEPTPKPSSESTPDLTPEPTPEPTPKPSSESTPEPTPEPTADAAPTDTTGGEEVTSAPPTPEPTEDVAGVPADLGTGSMQKFAMFVVVVLVLAVGWMHKEQVMEKCGGGGGGGGGNTSDPDLEMQQVPTHAASHVRIIEGTGEAGGERPGPSVVSPAASPVDDDGLPAGLQKEKKVKGLGGAKKVPMAKRPPVQQPQRTVVLHDEDGEDFEDDWGGGWGDEGASLMKND